MGKSGHDVRTGRRPLAVGLLAAAIALASAAPAAARSRGGDADSNGVPYLDIKGSCSDAQKFSSGVDKNIALKSCLQDEMSAKAELGKKWSTFKGKDKSNCVEQSRYPSPSYVEVLTCLEMSSDAMRNAPRVDGKPVPQIGGPVAPGLSPSPDPSVPTPTPTPQ